MAALLYKVFLFKYNKRLIPLFFIAGLAIFVFFYYFRISLSYPQLLMVNGLGLLICVITIFLVLLSKAKYKTQSRFFIFLAYFIFCAILPINIITKKNLYLAVDKNLDSLKIYLKKDREVWPNYLAFFPNEIPETAQSIRFFRGRLYDLTVLQVRYCLPADQIQKLLKESFPKAKIVLNGYTVKQKEKKVYWCHQFRNKDNNGFAPLPAHFKVLIFYVDPKVKGSLWQNYYSSGMAVSTLTNEVIYWATYP